MKSSPAPRDLFEVDVGLEDAVLCLRQYRQRLKKGRIHLSLEVIDDTTIRHDVAVDPLTEDEVARIMQERPRVKR